MASADWAASAWVGLAAATSGRGEVKCMSGSVMPKNTRPMPMPAAKSRENQDSVENSGFSSGLPSVIPPLRENAR